MKTFTRRSLKVVGWLVAALVVLVVLQVSVVAFPYPWFRSSVRDGRLTIYTDDPAGPDLQPLCHGVRGRIEAVEIYDDSIELRVFVCNSQGLYELFARLSRVPVHVPGFNLSLFNNSFVSVPLLEQRQRTNTAGIRHSVLAGDLDEAIAHELIHDLTQERIGFFAYRRIPEWKSEGYAEYAASRAARERDAEESLADRIATMKTKLRDPGAREYYRWSLVVEFLCEEMDYSFDAVMRADVTLDESTTRMLTWYREQP